MRINEILTESQLAQLDEGPIGSALGAVGRGVGSVARGLAKGVGAVAGGVVGAGKALKKGYQSGKAFVGDDPDPNKGQPGYDGGEPAPPAAAARGAAPAAPAAGGAPAPEPAPTTAQDINAQGPAGTAPAKTQTGQAAAALTKTDAVTDKQTATKAGETVYAQVKANVDKLDAQGKKRILTLLQKSLAQQPAKPAAKPAPAAGGAEPAAAGAAPAPAAGGAEPAAAGAAPANTMANAPVSATNKADPSNPNLAAATPPAAADAAAPAGQGAFANIAGQLAPKPTGRPQGGGRVKGAGPSMTPSAIKKRDARAAAKAAAAAPAPVTASLVHPGRSLNEMLQEKIKTHQRTMFETQLIQGTASVFHR